MSDGEYLKDAIVEAARKLVREHVESALVDDATDETYAEITIHPRKGLSYGRLISHDDTTDDLYSAILELLCAVDEYDEWKAKSESSDGA